MEKKMVISSGSCNGEEVQFMTWMNENHPDIESVIENTDKGGLYIWDEEYQEWAAIPEHNNYWDLYCKSL